MMPRKFTALTLFTILPIQTIFTLRCARDQDQHGDQHFENENEEECPNAGSFV
jgi:hypothetical protein